jgi:hypothetical protein
MNWEKFKKAYSNLNGRLVQGLIRQPEPVSLDEIVRANNKLQYYALANRDHLPSDLEYLISKLDKAIKDVT